MVRVHLLALCLFVVVPNNHGHAELLPVMELQVVTLHWWLAAMSPSLCGPWWQCDCGGWAQSMLLPLVVRAHLLVVPVTTQHLSLFLHGMMVSH